MDNKILVNSLWTDCLIGMIEVARQKNIDSLDIKDVDALAVQRSKEIVDYAYFEETEKENNINPDNIMKNLEEI